jgi:hypothetical protein
VKSHTKQVDCDGGAALVTHNAMLTEGNRQNAGRLAILVTRAHARILASGAKSAHKY